MVYTDDKIFKFRMVERLGTYDISIPFGYPSHKMILEMDMSISFMWLGKYRSLPNNVQQIASNIIINYPYMTMQGDLYLTDLIFNNQLSSSDDPIILKDFPFYLIDSRNIPTFDSFPLGRQIFNESFSIIHSLYNNCFINKKSFGLYYNKQNYDSWLYIGGIPREVLDHKPYNTTCSINQTNSSQWTCTLNSIIIQSDETETYINEHPLIFQSNTEYILAPYDFISFMHKEIFNKYYMHNNTCHIYQTINSYTAKCNVSLINTFPNISFIINNTLFTFSQNDLFDDDYFIIILNEDDDNEWKFGIKFLSKYISYFNYETNTISFYNSIPFKTLHSSSQILIHNIKSLLLINIILMCICSTQIFLLKTKLIKKQ